MKQLTSIKLLALVASLFCSISAVAVEAYTHYTSDNTTLTFYYDNLRSSRVGKTYVIDTVTNVPRWKTEGVSASVTQVVFDPSFADALPKTTYCWFSGMTNLESISGLNYLNTSQVAVMSHMFYNCSALTSIDASHFNTENATHMRAMFLGCEVLTSLDLSNFNTGNATGMYDMYEGCKSLTTLDLSNFDTKKVTNMCGMFNGCSNLTTIYANSSWTTTPTGYSDYTFTDCTSLVGGMGTAYDADHTNSSYAHFDGGPSNPGYFTEKPSLRGDINGDGKVTIADVTELINMLLTGQATPELADLNGDGKANISDVIALINYLLRHTW